MSMGIISDSKYVASPDVVRQGLHTRSEFSRYAIPSFSQFDLLSRTVAQSGAA